MRETKAFVYKWTELSTGKWYIGSRSRKGCYPDGYICSSKIVKPLILENRNNWKREIMAMGEPKAMVQYEANLLMLLNARFDPMSYNLHNGDGKFTLTEVKGNRKGKAPWNKGLTKETPPIIAKYAKNLPAILKGRPRLKGDKNLSFGKEPWNKGKKNPQGSPWNKGLPFEKQPFYGKTFTKEQRKHLSDGQKESWKNRKDRTPWNKGLTLSPQSPELIEKRVAPLRGRKQDIEITNRVKETKAQRKKEREVKGIKLFTWEEKYDQKYVEERKEKLIERCKTNNPNAKNKGKTWDEIMGPERAEERRNKLSNPTKPRKKRCDIGKSRKKES